MGQFIGFWVFFFPLSLFPWPFLLAFVHLLFGWCFCFLVGSWYFSTFLLYCSSENSMEVAIQKKKGRRLL